MPTSKTISGHHGSEISIAHNNRDLIAKNVDVNLIANNVPYVTAGAPVSPSEGVRYATLEEIYQKVFEPSWKAFQERQRSDRKSEHGSYLEELRAKRAAEDAKLVNSKKKYHKTKSPSYEMLFQIGNQEDTNVLKHPEDSARARNILDQFTHHLLQLPYVHVVTSRELEDPNWEPPGEAGLLVYNCIMHGDEPDGCRHDHIDYIPYFKSERGQSIQTGLGQTFAKLGYDSRYAVKLDDNGQPIPKKNKKGEVRKDKNGDVIYEKENTEAGVYDWIEQQKRWIEDRMMALYSWERDRQGDHRRHLDTPEYKAMREEQKRLEQEQKLLKHEIEILDTIKGQSMRDAENAHEKAQELKAEVKQLETKKGTLTDDVDALSGAVENLRTERDSLTDDVDELKEESKTLQEETAQQMEGIKSLAQLRTMAEYQAQVVENDYVLSGINGAINEAVRFAREENMKLNVVQRLVNYILNGMREMIEALRIQISRVKLFERLHNIFGESQAGPRQERSLDDILDRAYKISDEYNQEHSDVPGKDEYGH